MPIKIQQQKAVGNTQYQSAVQAANKRAICDKGIPGSSDNPKLMFPRQLLPMKFWY